MRVMALDSRHEISDNDKRNFGLNLSQIVFLEEYLSNGMASTDAMRQALKVSSPEVYEKNKDNRRYFSMRASATLKTRGVEGYLAKIQEKSTVSSVTQVLQVVSSIMSDDEAENKDRLKAAELMLKHYNAFSKHQEAKAPKSLTVNAVKQLTDKELEDELNKRLSTLQSTHTKSSTEIEDAQIEE
jgi:hypothetical protein